MEHPKQGERFTATVDRISNSNNGIVETEQGHINLGKIKESAVGQQVTGIVVTGDIAICMAKWARNENYSETCKQMLGENIFESITSPPPENLDSGLRCYCPNCRSILKKGSKRWICKSCEYSHLRDLSKSMSSKISNEIETNSKIHSPSKQDSKSSDEQTQQTDIEDSSIDKLARLRKRAEESATDTVEKGHTTSNNTEQYYRSTEVREYVMARAEGVCEGCEEPAPFRSKSGGPYLHAHHLYELSEGGSDTPGTVIALCPNCHYRVHHGEDGKEYNQQLIQKIQNKEQ